MNWYERRCNAQRQLVEKLVDLLVDNLVDVRSRCRTGAIPCHPFPGRYVTPVRGSRQFRVQGWIILSERGLNASPPGAARPGLAAVLQLSHRRNLPAVDQAIHRFCSGRRRPREPGAAEVTAFLNHLPAQLHRPPPRARPWQLCSCSARRFCRAASLWGSSMPSARCGSQIREARESERRASGLNR